MPVCEGNRNWGCTALLQVKVKLLTADTRKKDKYLREESPLRGVIEVQTEHTHNLDTSTIRMYFRPGQGLRDTFEEYFFTMTATVAHVHHESLLRTRENGEDLLGDGHFNPLLYTVQWWYKEWRTVNFGPMDSPLQTLQQKVGLYKDKGLIFTFTLLQICKLFPVDQK